METSVFPLPIEVDGKPVASLGPNQYTRVELPPGRHHIGAPDTYGTRVIAGTPHPVDLTIQPGKTYYLLPTRWAGNPRTTITTVGTMAIPEVTAESHSSFSVQSSVPSDFLQLTYVERQ
jgi:hypothetical protein